MSTHDPHENSVVLVVEDEILIREDVIDVLERNGFETLRAANVDDALSVLAARPDIRALFTDVQMPGSLDGIDLARHVAADRPEIALLVTSGRSYAPDDLPATGRFLPKPYMPATVVRILREMIAADHGGAWDPGFGRSNGNHTSPASTH